MLISRGEGTPLALVEAMLCGRPAIVSDVGGNQEWVTEAQTGFVAEAPVLGLARATLERAWSARESWPAMGMEAHKVATTKVNDPSIPALLDVFLEAGRHKRPVDAVNGQECERLKQYRALMTPTLSKQTRLLAQAASLRFRRILNRWRAAREEAARRQLLRLEQSQKPQ